VRGPSWGPGQGVDRLRSCRRDDTGAAAVEFALVALLLFTLLLGIIEVTLLLRDNVSVSSAVRTGARIASAEAGAGPGTCPSGANPPPCSPANVPKLAQDAADAIQRAGTAMPQDAIDEIWVYKSNSSGFPGTATTLAASTCTSNCVVYRWNDASNRFQYASGTWISSTINACIGSSDAVGVLMKATHQYLFGLFGTTQSMSDRAVMQFEPLPGAQGAPGAHP
jgi:Flp pilus assembly pilin Flp